MNGIQHAFSVFLIISALVVVVALPQARADAHDLVILYGRVMDPETGFDGVRNVGIKGGKIVTITSKGIGGKETINAKGLVVAPGFIDTHFHSLTPHGVKLALRNGVTTGMDLELGALEIDKWYDEKEKTFQYTFDILAYTDLLWNDYHCFICSHRLKHCFTCRMVR